MIWLFGRVCFTLREETFANKIFAIYDLICKNLLRKNKENATSYEKLYDFQRKLTKTEHDSQKLVLQNSVFGLMNRKNKFCKNFFRKQFLPFIASTAFKLNDLLTTFLFFRLFDNALMKTYSLYGCRGGKKSFQETKICGVIFSKWILFI